MNRKLFNGLLLLTVATGGIGTFTSCKDTEQDFRNEILNSQEQLRSDLLNKINALNADLGKIRDLTDPEFLNNLDKEIQRLIDANKFDEAAFLETVKALIKAGDDDLQKKIDALDAAYKLADTALQKDIDDLGDRVTLLESTVNSMAQNIMDQVQVELDKLQDNIDDLKSYVDRQDDEIKDSISLLSKRVDDMDAAITTAQNTADAAQKAAEKAQQAADAAQAAADLAQKDATKALADAALNAKTIDTLKTSLADLDLKVGGLEGDLKNLNDSVDVLKTKYTQMFNDLKVLDGKVANLTDSLTDLSAKYTALNGKVDGLETSLTNLRSDFEEYQVNTDDALTKHGEAIEALNAAVENIYNKFMQKFANLVTGIVVEEVQNAIFGSFSFPLGIESNIIANYYAYADHNVDFPSFNREYTTNEELADINLSAINAPIEYNILEGGKVNIEKLADLYLTVNPANRNFEGLTLSLVNSQDEQVLDAFKLKPTDHVVTMGVTRAAQNGFYAAEMVSSDADKDVEAIRYEIVDGLKGAFKDVIKNHTKADFIELAKLIVKQFGSDMPAYAVKCEWDDTMINADGEEVAVKNSVRSGYDLAVTTFRPLSYTTAYGLWDGHNIPQLKDDVSMGFITDRIKRAFADIKNQLNLGLKPVEVGDISIDLSDVKVNIDEMSITVDLEGSPVYKANGDGTPNMDEPIGVLGPEAKIVLQYIPGTDGELGTGDLAPLANSIKKAIEEMLSGEGDDSLTVQIQKQLEKQIGDIIGQVNDQLTGVQSKIDSTIADIESKVNGFLNGRFGRFADRVLDLYNRLAGKINNVIADPNAYLQVLMAYMGNDNELHRLATMANDPTPLKVGQTMELFATSYNAEIIVPSFKKYVAVVDATGTDGKTWGNYEAAKRANEANYLNTVRPGEQQRFYIDGSKLEAGRIYKVLYSSLDYQGRTSSKVYYVRATR